MPSNAVVNAAASGDNTIIAAPGVGKQLEIRGYNIVAAGAVTATWKNGSTALTGAMTMATGAPNVYIVDDNDHVFLLSDNTAFVLALGGSVQVSGHVTYVIRRIDPTTS
jgi:hypothetical protein